MKRSTMFGIVLLVVAGLTSVVHAAPQLFSSGTPYPFDVSKLNFSVLVAKGTDVGGYYVVQVDPTTGAIATTSSTSTTAIGSSTKVGSSTCAALSGTYATVVATTFTTCILQVFNSCNGDVTLSFNGGGVDSRILAAGQSLSVDFCANGKNIASGVNIQAKDGSSAATTGTLSISLE